MVQKYIKFHHSLTIGSDSIFFLVTVKVNSGYTLPFVFHFNELQKYKNSKK